MVRYIFVLGGVISGLGKGVTASSICQILRKLGYQVTIKKLDPYLNVDPGTMNPMEHGEVFVTASGAEVDLDLGHYERIGGIECSQNNSTSSGKILYDLLNQERNGVFLGKTLQLIPHFVDAIQNFIELEATKYDFIIIEVGGSVGDYEACYFLESVRRMIQLYGKEKVLVCFVTYILNYQPTDELKTKPTQVALKQLMSSGVQADIIFARTEKHLDDKTKQKISLYTNVKVTNIITASNVDNIYEVPSIYCKEGFLNCIHKHFHLEILQKPDFTDWHTLHQKINQSSQIVTIGLVGKYVELNDSYYSVVEALHHAAWNLGVKLNLKWINARHQFDPKLLLDTQGVIIPGGFGSTGIENIIKYITLCRTQKIPFLGICLGFQLAVIEFAREVIGLKEANSTEFENMGGLFLIKRITEFLDSEGNPFRIEKDTKYGGTMRLGNFTTHLKENTLIRKLYEKSEIEIRHRHRYEVDIKYIEDFKKRGMLFSGISEDGQFPEMIELPEHPFYVGTQGHPEFQSRPFQPEPMFIGFMKRAGKSSN